MTVTTDGSYERCPYDSAKLAAHLGGVGVLALSFVLDQAFNEESWERPGDWGRFSTIELMKTWARIAEMMFAESIRLADGADAGTLRLYVSRSGFIFMPARSIAEAVARAIECPECESALPDPNTPPHTLDWVPVPDGTLLAVADQDGDGFDPNDQRIRARGAAIEIVGCEELADRLAREQDWLLEDHCRRIPAFQFRNGERKT